MANEKDYTSLLGRFISGKQLWNNSPKINHLNSPHLQNKGKKSHSYLNRWQNKKNQHLFVIK